jgi:plasmid stabilization system protein ParE
MKRVRVSHLAERDLDAIWYYIARKSGSIEIADRLVESITETFPLLHRLRKRALGAMKSHPAEGSRLGTTSSTRARGVASRNGI